MVSDINIPLILVAALLAVASPGPATLAIAGTSMGTGRRAGLALAAGVTTGSLMWSCAAALGLGAVMLAHAWMFELMRYFGVSYLLFLAYKAARAALRPDKLAAEPVQGGSATLFVKGLLLHLTNPKAILFFGALYSLGVPVGTTMADLWGVIGAVGIQSALVFHGYALLFSAPAVMRAYLKLRRWFEGAFAVGFGLAGLKILTARLQNP